MGFDSIWHWLILLVVVLLIFGTSKLKNIGSDLGGAVRSFKKAMSEDEDGNKNAAAKTTEQLQAATPEQDASAEKAKTQDRAP